MRRHRGMLSLLALPCILAACSTTSTEPRPLAELSPQKLQRMLDSLVDVLHVPGAVVGIQAAYGSQLMLSSGVSNLSTGAALTAQERFRVGSITKTMISTVILQLVDEGKLSIDDRLSKYVPSSVTNVPFATIRHLLTHTSGIPDYTDDPGFETAVETNPGRTWAPEELVAIANKGSSPFPPGAAGQWQYSNTNYILLGMVIENILGEQIGTVLQSRIFGPLGMTKTFFAYTSDTPSPFSRGYVNVSGNVDIDVASLVSPTFAGAAGAVVSSAGDLLIWSSALASGKLLSSARHLAQIQVVPASGSAAYGMGVETFGHWIGHSGETPGYQTDMYTRPGVGTIVVLVNKTTDTAASRQIFDAMRWGRFPLL